MFKAIIIASAMSAVLAGAATMAIANNSARANSVENTGPVASAKETHGIVDCASQQWPAIDVMCLTPASEEGSVRPVRLVRM